MSPAKPNPLELAKQGDPNAIAALLNRTLQPKGIIATAEQEDGFLHILLRSAQVPNQLAVVSFIHQGMTKLQSEAIHTVRIDGYQTGQDIPAWSDEFPLETAGLFPADIMPPIDEPSSYGDRNPPGVDIDDEYPPEPDGIDGERDYGSEGMEYDADETDDVEEEPPVQRKRPVNKLLLLVGGLLLLAAAAVAAAVILKLPIPGLPFGNETETASPPAGSPGASPKPAAPAGTTNKPAAPAAPNKPATPIPAATPNKPATPNRPATLAPAATPNKPATQSDPWREGVNKATSAANLAQTAYTQAEWDTVAAQWQQAIDLMKKVPQSNPNYQAAQERVTKYQANLDYAKQNAANSY